MKTTELPKSNKILYPASGITKGDLIHYYREIAAYMLPYLQDRPLTMHRFPNGIAKAGFFQKNASNYFPGWIKTERIRKKNGWVNHVICNNQETLEYLAAQGTITFHITLSRIDKLNYPDRLIFDLDPPDENFKLVRFGAEILRHLLERELELSTYVMLTGSDGIHLVIPLMRVENFDEVRDFAKNVARYLVGKYPDDLTIEMRKDQRKGRLFLDYLRNSYGQTAVCPYSLRAIEEAPVAVPISWDELTHTSDSRAYTIHTIFDRLKENPNPWNNFTKNTKILSDARRKLKHLMEAELEGDTSSKSIKK